MAGRWGDSRSIMGDTSGLHQGMDYGGQAELPHVPGSHYAPPTLPPYYSGHFSRMYKMRLRGNACHI